MWIPLLYAKAYLFKRPNGMDDKKAIWSGYFQFDSS